jgi:hypothetical protein
MIRRRMRIFGTLKTQSARALSMFSKYANPTSPSADGARS